ncbi:MarR family transcriptional regulator [Bradyrhizobium sp. B097]|uniref:MarR family winged helix-turn-helix transcriptional regulator n=1 Tax=Bradyrhizobium sp. B097 TaxID=3140244 RepID=UPI003182C728
MRYRAVKGADVSGFDRESLKAVAAECPGFQARATARAVTRFYNACFKPLGLTAEQFSLLVGIGASEPATLVDLAVSAGVDTTTLSRNVRNLEERGLVCAEGGRGRAGKRLSLTSSGRRLMVDAFPVWTWAKGELSRRLGEKRLRSVRQAMAELAKAAEDSSSVAPEPSARSR